METLKNIIATVGGITLMIGVGIYLYAQWYKLKYRRYATKASWNDAFGKGEDKDTKTAENQQKFEEAKAQYDKLFGRATIFILAGLALVIGNSFIPK